MTDVARNFRIRTRFAAAVTCLLSLLLASCGAGGGGGNELRAIGTLPIDSYGSDALDRLKKSVEDATGSSLTIETFPAGQLYNDEDAVESIPNAAADLGIVQMDFWTGKSPLLGALYIPMLYEDKEHFYRARDKMTDALNAELLETANSRIIGWFNYSPQTIVSTKKIATLDDFNGMKLRGWGEYSSQFLGSAGADPVVMGAADVYDGIQKGTIDGAMSAWTSQVERKFFEVGDYMINTNLQPVTAYGVVINNDVWETLTEEQQTALQDAGEDIGTWSDKQMKSETAESIAALEKNGVEITSIDGSAVTQIQDATVPELKDLYLKNTGNEGREPLAAVESTRK